MSSGGCVGGGRGERREWGALPREGGWQAASTAAAAGGPGGGSPRPGKGRWCVGGGAEKGGTGAPGRGPCPEQAPVASRVFSVVWVNFRCGINFILEANFFPR